MKLLYKIGQGFSILFLSIGFLNCTHKTTNEFLGPGVVPAQAGFKINSIQFVTTSDYLFTKGDSTYFLASFSQKVSWKLSISGLSSKAFKSFSGVSDSLTNKNNVWKGDSDNNYFFSGEAIAVALKIDGLDSVYRDTLTLYFSKKYDEGQIVRGVRTTVVDDMELGTYDTSKFDNAYSDLYPQEKAVVSTKKQYSDQKVQGSFSYYMEGVDYNFNTYVAGSNTVSLTALAGKIQSTDPNDVYVNLYVYGFGTPNTAMNIILYELDTLTQSKNLKLRIGTGYNPDGTNYVLDQNKNDVWQTLIPVDWTGWKLVSLKYNQFRKHNTLGHQGNNRFEPNKLAGIALEVASSPNMVAVVVKTAFDYVTITEGGPFSFVK